MHSIRFSLYLAAVLVVVCVASLSAATPANEKEAQQLKVVQAMSGELRARIDQLPVVIPAGHAIADVADRTVTLNRNAVVIDGQRFDGVVVVAPETKASFGWALVAPANLATWYILREKGDMKGFAEFLFRTRAQVPQAAALKPEDGAKVTFQKLDSAQWTPGERYILWFRFKDDKPAEFSLRAAFFARPSLNQNSLPALLFPTAAK
jgi:hypothetical protein